MRSLFFLFSAILSLGAVAGDYAIIDSDEARFGRFSVRETVVQDGVEPVNRFLVHRWAKKHSRPRAVRGVLLLQSGLGGSFRLFEIDDDPTKRGSTAAFFARRNFVVYGYSPRATLLEAGDCESGAVDCSPMADWDLDTYVDDLLFIRDLIAAEQPDVPVVIGGLSLGAIDSIAVLNRAPDAFDGAIVWEGMLASSDPAVIGLNASYCAFMEGELMMGNYVDGQSLPGFKQIALLGEQDPDGISPIAPMFGLPAGTTNHQLFVFGLTTPTPGPATMPVPDYVLVGGDYTTDSFDYIDETRILADIAEFSDYVPNGVVRDISCSLAGAETRYTDNLAAFDGPILAIGGGRGFGAYMDDNLALFSSAYVDFILTDAFGHVDHIFLPTPFHRLFVELPILRWLHRKVLR